MASKYIYADDDIEILLSKHGTHDQKTHGNWAVGVSLEVASEIQRYTREWGGLSISMVDGHQPTIGFMVAKPPEFGKIVDEADFFDPEKGPKIMSQYMREQKADLATGKNYLGTWLKDGKIYLDVSENIMDRDEAIRLGQERNQKAIWDVVNQTEIETGGTGRVEKGNQDGGVKEPRRYDGRGDRRLRTGSLAEVYGERQKTQVIRFEYGLKPVLKHEGGGHDQSSHGNWATGETKSKWEEKGYSPEQASRIEAMEGKGPTLDDLDAVLSGGDTFTSDEMIDYVMNDRGLYEEMLDEYDVNGKLEVAIADFKYANGREPTDSEQAQMFETIQNQAVEGYVDNNYSLLTQSMNESNGTKTQASDLEDSFREIYDVSVDYEDDGYTATINSRVVNVSQEDESTIMVEGNIDVDGMNIGNFERKFYKNDDGTWSVEHKWLSIDDEYQGKGFGGKFIGQSEDYYAAIGVRDIFVTAGLEDGARHWARAGFDWDAPTVGTSFEKLAWRVEQDESIKFSEQDKQEFDSIWSRGAQSVSTAPGYPNRVSIKDLKSDDFPFPAEFASIGWDRRTRDAMGEWDWAGKRLMNGLVMDYRKPITAEGRSLLSGPIDADGDGLIYDGTARERPAPQK